MKKVLIALSVFASSAIYATAPEGISAAFWQKKQHITAQQNEVYEKIDALNEIRLAGELDATQQKNYHALVCQAVTIETQFAELLKSDLTQAKILLEDDSANVATIDTMIQSSENYETAQEWIGTAQECK